MHPRTALRDAAKTAIAAALPSARVVGFRGFARNTSQLPAIEVTTPSEQIERISDDGSLRRTITLAVLAVAASTGDIENALDALAQTIEAVVFGAVQAGPFEASIVSASSEFDPGGADEVGTIRPGSLTSTFTVVVYADDSDPSGI